MRWYAPPAGNAVFWSGFVAGVAFAVVAAVIVGFIAALIVGWKLINADAEGIEPTNDIRELNREDGGRGPIA